MIFIAKHHRLFDKKLNQIGGKKWQHQRYGMKLL